MNKIREAFENKKAFIGFIVAGDPQLAKTEEFIIEMERAGAALVEIGIPFSDPIAEGPTVQEANVRALSAAGGCTTDMVFDMAERVNKKIRIPLVLFTYLNPVFKYGYEAFMKRCNETGISGLIVPDLPYEERGELKPFAKKYGVDIISTVAAISGEERVKMIAKEAEGYIYLLPPADESVTEAKKLSLIVDVVKNIRQVSDTPVAVAFNTAMSSQFEKYRDVADGVIATDEIVRIIAGHGEASGKAIYDYVNGMVKGK